MTPGGDSEHTGGQDCYLEGHNTLRNRLPGTSRHSAKANSKCPTLGKKNLMHQDRLEADQLGRSSAEKGLRLMVDTELTMSQQHALAAKASSSLAV